MGVLPIPKSPLPAPTRIDMAGTANSGPFAVTNVLQNGFTTGRLVNLEVDDSGNISVFEWESVNLAQNFFGDL